MLYTRCLGIASLAFSLIALPASLKADDVPDTKTSTEKPAEKLAPQEVTTEGSVDVGGAHVAYTAIAGTLTVGATDEQDAQLGLDGKPQQNSQLALNAPKEPKDAPATARMFYVAYFK